MRLYKYYSPRQYNFCAVCQREFWFATNKLLNDPYDLYSGQALLQFPTCKSVMLKDRLAYILKANKMSEKLQELCAYIARYASSSFTLNPIDRLMWGHYADSYQGFCVGFEIPDKIVQEKKEWQEVVYMDQIPKYLYFYPNKKVVKKDKESFPIMSEPISIENFVTNWCKNPHLEDDEFIYKMLSIKAQEWCYEQEYRLIKTIDGDGMCVPWPEDLKIKEIILGSKFDKKSNISFITQMRSKYPNLLVRQLRLDNAGYFALNIENLKK